MTYRGSCLLAAVLLLASACSEPAETPEPSPSEAEEAGTEAVPAASEGGDANEAAADATTFPVAMRGSWGKAASDCEPGRLDALGLIKIDAGTIEYYESVARLGSVAEHAPDRLRASFTFEGEGMTWPMDMLLELDGDTLVSTQFGDEAVAEPGIYSRCK